LGQIQTAPSNNFGERKHGKRAPITAPFYMLKRPQFSPIFNSKKQVQNWINQDKKRQTKTKEFI
ncbi:MAG: hypothetical protein SPK82_01530, partial [Eubacteriales bacterium]|nr:hypothetical protein [Eubacteriales bacterium]